MALKLLQGACLEGCLKSGVLWIRGDDVAAFFQFYGPVQGVHLDLSTDTLGSLAPF